MVLKYDTQKIEFLKIQTKKTHEKVLNKESIIWQIIGSPVDRESIVRLDYRPCPVQTVIISPYRAFILPLVRPQTAVVGVTQSPEDV